MFGYDFNTFFDIIQCFLSWNVEIVVYRTAKALPFGEGAPEGGGRGAVDSTVVLIAFGEFVLR